MGVLNVTPDSFSDGGAHVGIDQAVEAGLTMLTRGASIIDVGGESTRPGADPVSERVELARVQPVIEALRARTDAVISIDTTKAAVARAALAAGADVINDVTALTADPQMVDVAVESGCGVILMHMRGQPKTMQRGDLSSVDIMGEVLEYLDQRIAQVVARGVAREAICVDPGIGFGKTVAQNLQLIAESARLDALGRPVLLGPSRKSFIGALIDRPVSDRCAGTGAACAAAAARGVHVLRVHDVAEMRDVVIVSEAIESISPTWGGR